jgi:hypothetical protein
VFFFDKRAIEGILIANLFLCLMRRQLALKKLKQLLLQQNYDELMVNGHKCINVCLKPDTKVLFVDRNNFESSDIFHQSFLLFGILMA